MCSLFRWFRKARRKLIANSRGFSSIVGAVFAVLVMISLISTVFVWSLSQNTLYNNTVTQTRQADLDRSNEKIVANITVSRVDGTNVAIDGNLSNEGPLSVQIVTLWVLGANPTTLQTTYAKSPLSITLKPGNVTTLSGSTAITVPLVNSPTDSLSCWFISGRGNTIFKNPLLAATTTVGIPPVAMTAQGIGSIAMDFKAFRSYVVNNGQLGAPSFSYSIPQTATTAFSLNLTDYDSTQKNINLTSSTCFWVFNPPDSHGAIKGWTWPIAKVNGNQITPFGPGDVLVLPYNQTRTIYFGPSNPGQQLSTTGAAVNLLLTGKIWNSTNSDDYGQNLPFIAIIITP